MRTLEARPELIPGLLGAAVFVIWAGFEGGFPPTSGYPGGLFLLALLVVVAVIYRGALPRPGSPQGVAVLCLAGFTLWSFFSISWADVKGDAWDGADRALLYLTIYALFVIPRWDRWSAAVVLGGFSVAIAALGAIVFIHAGGSADPSLYLIDHRFVEPTGYHNANAALFLIALWPAFYLSCQREVPWALRGLMLATAGVLLELALLPQSRGSIVAFPIVAVLYLALVTRRARALVMMVPLAAVVALASGALLDVFTVASEGGDLGGQISSAGHAIEISFAVLFTIGAVVGLAEGRARISARTGQIAARVIGGIAAAAALVGLVIAIGVIGNPASWAKDRWDNFKSGQPEKAFTGSRLGGSLGSNRYDFWRVAADEFGDSPLTGAGSGNFAVDYLRERDSGEEPADPHNLQLSVLSQTGLVGALLFGGFLVAAAVGPVRVRLRGDPLAAGLAIAALASVCYWFLHSAGDWFWMYPALTGPAIAWLAVAGRLDAAPDEQAPWPSTGAARAAAGVAGALAVVAAIALLLPWIAERKVKDAATHWTADPAAAYKELDSAAGINFLSARPYLIQGTIASRAGDAREMRIAFGRALERDSHNWYALLELGALDALEGHRSQALRRLDRARALSPKDPLIRSVRRQIAAGHKVPLVDIQNDLLGRVCTRIGRTQSTRYCKPPPRSG
jgi:O-antigen ligase